jgi:hypothetical protein
MKLEMMKLKLLIAAGLLCLFTTCSKDKYTDAPQLEFVSVSSTVIPGGSTIVFNFKFTDKQGDIQDSIFYKRVSRVCPNNFDTAVGREVFPSIISQKNLQGDIELTLQSGTFVNPCFIPPSFFRTDTATFKFWIRDKAKNVSDTVTSPPIVILQ